MTELHHDLADLNDTALRGCSQSAGGIGARAIGTATTAITGYLGGMREEFFDRRGRIWPACALPAHAAAEQATRAAESSAAAAPPGSYHAKERRSIARRGGGRDNRAPEVVALRLGYCGPRRTLN